MLDAFGTAIVNVAALLAGAAAIGLGGMRARHRLFHSRWRPVADVAVVAAAAVAVTGSVVEIAALFDDVPVRVTPARRYFEYQPGQFGPVPNERTSAPPLRRWPGYEIRTNEDGLRVDHPRLGEPAHDERRVMFFGDSFTFGIGLNVEHSYPVQAAHLLEAAALGFRWVALNAGVGGINVFTAVDRFAFLAPLYRPRVAVFTVGEGDDILPDVNTELRRGGRDPLQPLGRFALYRLARKVSQTLRYVQAREQGRRVAAGDLPEERARLLAELEASAALMAETARRAGCVVVFNRILPRSRQWDASYPIEHSMLYPYIAAGASVVDTAWDLDDASLAIPDDGHPTPAGALLLARTAVPAILAAAER